MPARSAVNILKNKYLVSLLAFIIWTSFFDRNDLFTQLERRKELRQLETSEAYYEQEITGIKKELADLQNDPAILEKFAREKFYLKRDNEDVFIIEDENEVK